MHTRVFKELNLPHTYEAFDVPPENLKQFIRDAGEPQATSHKPQANLAGINVTIPHKVAVMKYLNEIKDEAKQIQAVNTIHNNEGYNTDAFGFQESLKEEGINLENKNVLVIGAGGVSRAILVSLINNNANVTLTNRTKQKAINLLQELNFQDKIKIIDYQELTTNNQLPKVDILVNTTSVGMHPHEDKSPIDKNLLKPNHIIFDAIYNPLKTKLIKDAEAIGCKTISGVNMLVHQGAQSLRIWLGINPPIQSMKDEVLKNLLR
jgi:shikimate dehydrogenase